MVAARSVADSLAAGQVFADMNSAGAPLKREVAALVEPTGALFADVALMAPVPGRGLRTPALVSGPGAELFAERIGGAGMPVEVVGPEPGQAAVRKLLRSVFMKGLAAAAIEALSSGGRRRLRGLAARGDRRRRSPRRTARCSSASRRAAASTRRGACMRWRMRRRCCVSWGSSRVFRTHRQVG